MVNFHCSHGNQGIQGNQGCELELELKLELKKLSFFAELELEKIFKHVRVYFDLYNIIKTEYKKHKSFLLEI